MQKRLIVPILSVALIGGAAAAARAPHLNPLIALLEARKPIFGLYAPSVPRGSAVTKTPAELAKDGLAYTASDFVFNGNMETGLDGRNPTPGVATPFDNFATFVGAMKDASTPAERWAHPLAVKTPKIAEDPAKAVENISRQLNVGVSTVVFVGVESAKEVQTGLAAMRFKSQGGTRPDAVGTAPAYWGLSEADYRKKADVWPLNPNGELVNWTIVESKEGLAHLDEIAAVKGIGTLFPGAGTLRSVFRGDPEGWENAIQQVLAACKKYHLQCGYPANEADIETRMKQGFDLFVIGWGDAGFRTIDIGRRVAGR
jgi:4-hydroxy-2-oxoheptanedioate aldolase